ncbi:DNA-binding protein [Streptomyces venezuelae ATCC 10712]|uniref:DNA-binding protein n=2 Tax=Streptomyces TaxID=1883 RepID=F2RL05_STRVP|nr:helix-turn-helix transcriptional regulator [Streptomyces venezuelae]APE21376.1 hypothetical protein vnz_10315 [Streptomyces venezuelae]QER98766.1 XRE family transcriptional regulator [Streptomyces venezuelae ATCC 10712]CCA55394.1 DNA-binding protein [Streptomyces venezuelae ATCC 10712]
MNHTSWRSVRSQRLASADTDEYEKAHQDARLAFMLGQMVYDLRTKLGLTQTALAERAGMKQPAISRIEGGGTVPTLPLLRRLADALDADLNISFTPRNTPAEAEVPAEVARGLTVAEAAEESVEPEITEAVEQDEPLFRSTMAWLEGSGQVDMGSLPEACLVYGAGELVAPTRRLTRHASSLRLHHWLVRAALLRRDDPSRQFFFQRSKVVRLLAQESSERRSEQLHSSLQSVRELFDSLAAELEDEAERLADA